VVSDRRLLRLINAYLKAGMMEGGLIEQRTSGTPQGQSLIAATVEHSIRRIGQRTGKQGDTVSAGMQMIVTYMSEAKRQANE